MTQLREIQFLFNVVLVNKFWNQLYIEMDVVSTHRYYFEQSPVKHPSTPCHNKLTMREGWNTEANDKTSMMTS